MEFHTIHLSSAYARALSPLHLPCENDVHLSHTLMSELTSRLLYTVTQTSTYLHWQIDLSTIWQSDYPLSSPVNWSYYPDTLNTVIHWRTYLTTQSHSKIYPFPVAPSHTVWHTHIYTDLHTLLSNFVHRSSILSYCPAYPYLHRPIGRSTLSHCLVYIPIIKITFVPWHTARPTFIHTDRIFYSIILSCTGLASSTHWAYNEIYIFSPISCTALHTFQSAGHSVYILCNADNQKLVRAMLQDPSFRGQTFWIRC